MHHTFKTSACKRCKRGQEHLLYGVLTAIACCGDLNCRFAAALGVAALQGLRDHAVHGRVLLPAAAMLEARPCISSMIKLMRLDCTA